MAANPRLTNKTVAPFDLQNHDAVLKPNSSRCFGVVKISAPAPKPAATACRQLLPLKPADVTLAWRNYEGDGP